MIIPLTNSDLSVTVNKSILPEIEAEWFATKLRLHSSGWVVAQRNHEGKVETVYLHKWIAEKHLIPAPDGCQLTCLDNNRLNCTVSNLAWRSRSEILAKGKANCIEYRKDINKYRARTVIKGVRHLGPNRDTENQAKHDYQIIQLEHGIIKNDSK